jgi:vacuolar-type H+-ATPase subunit F/Vma7
LPYSVHMIAGLSLDERIRILELVGVECYVAHNDDDALTLVRQLLKKIDVLIIDEDLYAKISQTIRRESENLRKSPLVVVLPSFSGPKHIVLKELKELISKAVGVELSIFRA